MEIISSQANNTIKLLQKLKQKKYREQERLFVVEGYRNVLDSALSFPQNVKQIVLSSSASEKHLKSFSAFNCVVAADNVIQAVSNQVTSQGVIGVFIKDKPTLPVNNCILLDNVQDPGNVGAILRSAVAFGYDVVLNNCCDAYSPKVVSSSMSALLKCNKCFNCDIATLKSLGYRIIVSDMSGKNVFESDIGSGKTAIVVGNEGNGVSGDIKASCDEILSIPQSGIESLNVAVAASIMMCVLKNKRTPQ